MYQYNKNLVSIITPGWNGKSFVHRLLESIIKQTYRPIEYIYVDDGSTDGTSEIVMNYGTKFKEADIDFKFIKRENGGICEALMTGFKEVQGLYLTCPEYDDILLPSSVEEKVKYLKEHPDCAVVTSDAWIVTENTLENREQLISHKNPNRFDRNHFYQALMSNSIFNAACYMVRMDLFDKTHPDRKIYSSRIAPNQQILLPLYYHYNRGFIETPLSLYMIRKGSLSYTDNNYKKIINTLNEYKKILYNTLDNINMPKDNLLLYKKRVKINVYKDYVTHAYAFKDQHLFFKALNYLQEENEIKPEYAIYAKRINNRFWLLIESAKKVLRYNRW